MDYTPPPELAPYHAFLQAAQDHFKGQPGLFSPVFGWLDLWSLKSQTEPLGEACMKQLQSRGVCELDNLQARNGDAVVMRIDRRCTILERKGEQSGTITLPLPPTVSKLLPAPKGKAAEALTCPDYKTAPAQAYLQPTIRWQSLTGHARIAQESMPALNRRPYSAALA